MDQLLHKVSQKVQDFAQEHSRDAGSPNPNPNPTPGSTGPASSDGSLKGHFRQGLPDVVFQAVDKYVDNLAPQISPIITKEIETFQKQTIDSLEAHLKEAFRSVFAGDLSAFRQVRDLDQLAFTKQRTEFGTAPQPTAAYGQRGLPFAPSAPGLGLAASGAQDRSVSGGQALISAIAAGLDAGGSRGGDTEAAQKELSVFQEALGKVSGFVRTQANHPGLGDEVTGFMNKMATEIDKVKADPEEMARKVVPEMKIKVGEVLTRQHAGLADHMTTAALNQLKKWLRGNTTMRDLGDGVKGDIADVMTSFFEKTSISSHTSSSFPGTRELNTGAGNTATRPPSTPQPGATAESGRAESPQPHGVAGILSKKLSRGLTHVRTSTRDDFRSLLAAIEKALFNELPESIRGPLAKLFGGDPFDPSIPSSTNREGARGKGIDIFEEIGDKFKAIVERVQKGLRDRVLEVVGGGHRRLESLAWMQVQETVVLKVRKYVPSIRVDIEEEDRAAVEAQK